MLNKETSCFLRSKFNFNENKLLMNCTDISISVSVEVQILLDYYNFTIQYFTLKRYEYNSTELGNLTYSRTPHNALLGTESRPEYDLAE